MKPAKIISLIGGILYLSFFISFLIISIKLKAVYGAMDIKYGYLTLTIVQLVGLALVLANFGYFYYLHIKSKKNEEVKNAIIFSVLLAAIPLSLYLVFTMISLLLPIYSITSAF